MSHLNISHPISQLDSMPSTVYEQVGDIVTADTPNKMFYSKTYQVHQGLYLVPVRIKLINGSSNYNYITLEIIDDDGAVLGSRRFVFSDVTETVNINHVFEVSIDDPTNIKFSLSHNGSSGHSAEIQMMYITRVQT